MTFFWYRALEASTPWRCPVKLGKDGKCPIKPRYGNGNWRSHMLRQPKPQGCISCQQGADGDKDGDKKKPQPVARVRRGYGVRRKFNPSLWGGRRVTFSKKPAEGSRYRGATW